MSPRRLLRLGLLALVALALSGCGYRLIRYGAADAPATRVALATLENDSYDPGVELLVTDALRKEFLRRGALRLVQDPAAADLVVRGRVVDVATRRRSFSSVVLALEYQVDVSLELEVLRAGQPLGVDPSVMAGSALYFASADIEATRKNREEALRRVSSLLASRVHDVLYELAPEPKEVPVEGVAPVEPPAGAPPAPRRPERPLGGEFPEEVD